MIFTRATFFSKRRRRTVFLLLRVKKPPLGVLASVDTPGRILRDALVVIQISQELTGSAQRVHDLLQFLLEHRAVQFLRAAGPPCMPELVAAAPEVHANMADSAKALIFFGMRGIK